MALQRALPVDLAEEIRTLIAEHGEPAVRRAFLHVLGVAADLPAEIRWALEFVAMKFPEWPFEFAKDVRLFQRVLASDRGLNLREALLAFEIHAIGDRKRPVKNWRSAFRTWCENGRKWGKPWAGRPGAPPPPAKVTPEEAAENRKAFQDMTATLAGKLGMRR
jgi:hypothetical protein